MNRLAERLIEFTWGCCKFAFLIAGCGLMLYCAYAALIIVGALFHFWAPRIG